MANVTLTLDEQKTKRYIELENKVRTLTEKRAAADTARTKALDDYNSKKSAAVTGQGPWDPVGPAHIAMCQMDKMVEDYSTALSATQSLMMEARKVMTEEVVKAARAAVGLS